jgi:hypothetical protein
MKVWKIRQYLPALLLYVQRRVGGERGFLVAVRTRDICGVDRRCGQGGAQPHDEACGEGAGEEVQEEAPT